MFVQNAVISISLRASSTSRNQISPLCRRQNRILVKEGKHKSELGTKQLGTLSSSVEEKPIFVLFLALKWMIINIVITQIVVAFIFFVFIYAFFGFLWATVAVVALVLFTQIVCYLAIFAPYRSWKMELVGKRLKVYYRGDLLQDASYSDIVKIGLKRYALLSKRYLLYWNENRVIVALPSNPRRKELGGFRLVDWLKTKVTSSTEN